MVAASLADEENDADDPDHLKSISNVHVLQLPGLWYLFQSSDTKQSVPFQPDDFTNVEADNVVALAKKAFSASKEAASLAEQSKLFEASVDVSPSSSLTDVLLEVGKRVRSTCLLQRRSKKRRVPKPKVEVEDIRTPGKPNLQRKITETYNPLRLFLSSPGTKLLTVIEESELIGRIQGLMKLEEIKSKLQRQFSHKPTLVEWAAAVGIIGQALQTQLHSSNRSCAKLVHSNYRMAVHIARQYLGRGLRLQDLLQVIQTGNLQLSLGLFPSKANQLAQCIARHINSYS